jgi:hypothetical protein
MNHRRIGKVARLPENIRNQLNEFLDDGLEYQRILDWLAQNGFPGFTHNNISRWKDGGYQDWLRHYSRLDELEFKLKWAAQVAKDFQSNSLHQASLALTSLQFFEMLNRFDSAALARILETHPEKYPGLINSLARFTREMVVLQRFKNDQEEKARLAAQRKRTDKGGLTAQARDRVRGELHLLCADSKTDNQPVQNSSTTDNEPI